MTGPPWYDAWIRDLDALADLPADWDHAGARPITTSAIAAAFVFVYTMPGDVPRPQVVPRTGGGLQLEWHEPSVECELAFEPSGALSAVVWENRAPAQSSPAWARGLLARALQAVR